MCCVALPFAASADFGYDKRAGTPCRHLESDFRCGIHARLRPAGFKGCTVFDSFGAGQQVSQVTFAGHDWRAAPATVAWRMFAVFPVMRQLHELWYLTEALTLPRARALHGEPRRALAHTERLTRGGPDELAALDVAASGTPSPSCCGVPASGSVRACRVHGPTTGARTWSAPA